jgi:PIN domain nuclease of toxin-antitoxin system
LTAIRLDTHAWGGTLDGDGRLSPPARAAIEAADTVLVSPISF